MNTQGPAAVKTLAGLDQTGQLGTFVDRAGAASGLLPEDEQKPGFVSADRRQEKFRSSSVAATRGVAIGKQIATTAAGGGAMEFFTPWAEQAFNSLKAENPTKFY